MLERPWGVIVKQAQSQQVVYCEEECFCVLNIDLLYQNSINTFKVNVLLDLSGRPQYFKCILYLWNTHLYIHKEYMCYNDNKQ